MTTAGFRDPGSATFTFRNVGPVSNAELELGDLTIIAGRNNTGKTYLVYTLYGFLAMWDNWPGAMDFPVRGRDSTLERIFDQITERGRAVVAVSRDSLESERQTVMQALTRSFSREALPSVFSSPPEAFKEATIGVDLNDRLPDHMKPVEVDVRPKERLSITYDGDRLAVTANLPGPRDFHAPEFLYHVTRLYLRFLFPELPQSPFILSAERFGISLFYRDLDFTKNQLVDMLQKMGDRKRNESHFPFFLLDQVSRYTLPIKDNIDYTRSVFDIRKQRSELYDDGLFKDIRDLMDGYYTASSDRIEFRSRTRGEHRFIIPLYLASSSARGLSNLYFFLRHAARKDHLLIIDEPEGHLDTANQVLLARLLTRMVQAGIKVLLTTHSDYLVKEINNLIMLNSTFAGKTQVIRKLKYDKEDFIEPERIRAYVAREQGLHKCAIDKFGIDMPNFDETIDAINDVANELASRLTVDGAN